ncbi:MAG: hypothetical protein AAGG02_10000 [Cyanobacteria bacterium P01_H01_bin.15]
MRPKFPTLVILTLLCALLLVPFVLSSWYLPILRDQAFELHLFLQQDLYKMITGFTCLVFVFFEMVLTIRKRSKGWFIKIPLPGSVFFWRSLHIFAGVGLLAVTLIHTIGSQGLNFNTIFLWVFFAVTLSAMVGALTESGLVQSSQRYFGFGIKEKIEAANVSHKFDIKQMMQGTWVISKGSLVRNLRTYWLNTHIFLVAAFMVMLAIHIFMAYFFQ